MAKLGQLPMLERLTTGNASAPPAWLPATNVPFCNSKSETVYEAALAPSKGSTV